MLNIFKEIKKALNRKNKLEMAESWAKYLEKECNYLYKKSLRDERSITDLISENEKVSGENAALKKDLESVRAIATRLRDKVLATAATPAEHEFLNVCAGLYDNGQVIKRRTFKRVLGAALRERRSACKNRRGVTGEIGKLWQCRATEKSNKVNKGGGEA